MEALLTAKTSGLCFNKDDFMVKDFSVDKFVSNCRKFVSLETMLEDLGIYHKILCSAMIELINKDYADFVNLSSNLVGLDKSIKNLSLPLEKLKSEVEEMKKSLDETLNSAKSQFSKYSTAYKMKVLAHHALCVLEGLEKIENLNSLSLTSDKMPSDVLERMALDFNIVQFHMNKILSLKNNSLESKKEIIERVSESLMHNLEQLFLQSLSSNDTHSLYKVLRIYSVINKEAELEKFFSQTIVKPYMECHITEENILKLGLSKVYENVLNFITSSSIILEATRGTKKSVEIVPGYDFLVNAVWPEIVYSFELIAPVHVYAPGDPQLFHVNYTSTILFLDRFEHFCEVQTSVQRLRKHKSYTRFLSRWNLDVHFQIRFQEIAGKFEGSLLQGFAYVKDAEFVKRGTTNNYLLCVSCSLSECVKLCWDENIFLQPLCHNFFSLNLQLISRFNKWTYEHLKCDNEDKSISSVEAATLIRDAEMLTGEFTKLFEEKISFKVQRSIVEVAFRQSIKLLEDIIPRAHSLMIKSLTKKCCTHLKLISDIPRLYRKTNREIPSKPSSYVSLIFSNLTDFLTETNSILPAQSKKFCLEEVTNNIIAQCIVMIQDVLTAIKKMEDSLKILKRARDKGSNLSLSGGTMSDDDKIRRQLVIDINCVEEKVRSLGLDIDRLKSFKELKDLMNSTEKILPQNFS